MCGFTHFVDPKVGVSALVEQDGKVLLVQRAIEPGLGRWALPSGFVELNEVPEIAAARECEEETGLRVDGLVLLEVTHYSDDFRGAGLNLTYRARVAGGVLQPGDDAQDARFFTSEELPPGHQVAFASHRAALEGWQARVNNASWRDASDERESGPHGPCAML
jgi:ADP-ribose pyrophosphatase YjhB (NUDIX family)